MRERPLIVATVAALAGTAPVSAVALASTGQPPAGHRTTRLSLGTSGARYVNPFRGGGWAPARTDMGVDWIPLRTEPVRAIGDAEIIGADNEAAWPGHHIIWYQLLDGSHAGDIIYVAENIRHLLRAGTRVRAGQAIAQAVPAYPWTEWGWANQYGAPLAHRCYHEGEQTRAGKRMARFLQSLGVRPLDNPGRGPDGPSDGPPC
jgi:hypothetical protein